MKELGERSAAFHAELGEWLAGLPAAGIYLAGPEIKPAAEALSRKKPPFPCRYDGTPETWIGDLKRDIDKDSAVFIKASRAMKFENVYSSLVEVVKK
jgi:UDP-N-acetylmuramyl pentapeptide synthase